MDDYLETLEVGHAYDHINDFFEHYNLKYAISRMEKVLHTANSTDPWKERPPYSIIYFMLQVEKLVAAALLIQHSYSRRKCCILVSEKEIPDGKDFIPYNRDDCFWDNFPRQLSLKQYYDPYKALKKFAEQQEWEKILEDLTEYALSNGTIGEVHPPYNILHLRHHLLRLIEACHLLLVRSNHNLKTK